MEDRQEPGDHGEVRERRRSSLKEQYVQNLGGKRIVELFRKPNHSEKWKREFKVTWVNTETELSVGASHGGPYGAY